MRKLGLLIVMFVLFGCAEQPQPAVLPIPAAVPAISGVDMLTGDTLAVTCDGQMAVSGESPHYTLSCDVAAATETATVEATEAPTSEIGRAHV